MALAEFPVSIEPDWGFADDISANVNVVKFGDGYELRTKSGLNYLRKKWSPTWSSLVAEEAYLIKSFIEPKLKLTAFLWTHPADKVKYRVVCQELKISHDNYNNFVVELQLEQDFNL